jgi:hypothetical protein
MLVLDKRDTHMVVAMFAESDAGRHRDVSLFDQQLREFQRPEMPEFLRNRCPGEHRRLRRGNRESGLFETANQHIAALSVNLAHLGDIGTVSVQRGRSSNLDRRERAVIEIGFDPRKRGSAVHCRPRSPSATQAWRRSSTSM